MNFIKISKFPTFHRKNLKNVEFHEKKWNFQKKSKFSKFFKWANFCPKRFGESALESWNHELLKNKHFRIIRPHLLCVFNTFEEAWIWWFFLILKEHFLNPSSTTAEIKGNWGRMKIFLFFKNISCQLSNARFPDWFDPLVVENALNEHFTFLDFFAIKIQNPQINDLIL